MTLEALLKAKREEILRVCAKYGGGSKHFFSSAAHSKAERQR